MQKDRDQVKIETNEGKQHLKGEQKSTKKKQARPYEGLERPTPAECQVLLLSLCSCAAPRGLE